MHFISRKWHIVSDTVVVLILLGYPWLFIPGKKGVETICMLVPGISILCYSLLTKHEVGIFRFISFKVHLAIDYLLGIMLAASPWLLGFGSRVIWPHFITGLVLLLVAIFSTRASVPITRQEEAITF
jgi:hypothetical protein